MNWIDPSGQFQETPPPLPPPIVSFPGFPDSNSSYFSTYTINTSWITSETRIWLPKQVTGGTSAQDATLTTAYQEALSLLLYNTDCSTFLDGNQERLPLDPSKAGLAITTLENTTYGIFSFVPTYGPNTGALIPQGTTDQVFINSAPNGLFFTPGTTTYQGD